MSDHLRPKRPRTTVELVDTCYPDGTDVPLKPQMILVNGQPVMVERDGIEVQIGAPVSEDNCTRVTLTMFAHRLEIRGYRDSDKQWCEQPTEVVTPAPEVRRQELDLTELKIAAEQRQLAQAN